MICSRAWWALMRRDMVYRKRSPIGTLMEIAMPVAFVAILLGIKIAVEGTGDGLTSNTIPAILPTDYNFLTTHRPLTFTDYVTAMRAEKVCEEQVGDEEDFGVTGIANTGFNWMVPTVKCDAAQCTEVGEDASTYCEYAILAVAGEGENGMDRANEFAAWVYSTYPALTTDMPFDFDFIQIFNSSEEITKYVRRSDYGDEGVPKIAMGIVWEGGSANDYSYRLRQNSTNFNDPTGEAEPGAVTTPPTDQLLERLARDDFGPCINDNQGTPDLGILQDSCTGQYMFNGVLIFQRLVGDYILSSSGAADAGFFVGESGVIFTQFPTAPFEDDGFYSSLGDFGPVLVVLGLLYPTAVIIFNLVREKELRQKELMKMMSVTEGDIGCSWFCNYFLLHIVTIIVCTIISDGLYENTDAFYLFMFWLGTFLAVITFSMAITSVTSRATLAVVLGLLFFFCGVFIPLSYGYTDGDTGLIGLIGLHPVASFSYGLQEISRLEDLGVGVTSDTVNTTDEPSGYTFQSAISSLFVDSLIWGLVYAYFNRIIKPAYGQALPWNFCCLCSFWCPSKAGTSTDPDSLEDIEYDDTVPFEEVGDTLKNQAKQGKSIEIRNLRKSFGDKQAVDGLSLSIFSGQITALLGHNGAGKTTTINMLTGALAPSSGTAVVAGLDINTQLPQIRQNIGICLQHDCLFPQLTVREHVQFFARVKGLYSEVSSEEAEKQVDDAIKDVALNEKRNTLSKNLSGGQKRKLSVAIAFCGGSKVVLLDEPTSGMDPFSRRFTWNVIRRYREDRCIILTTHFMDEADILGDRIAIMAEGQLRCCGSSLFLKKTYGVGYQLTIEKKFDGASNKSTNDKISEALKNTVEKVDGASLLSDVGTELSFQLPIGSASQFTPVFQSLDKEIEKTNVTSYGVSITTLDEVFLLVARGGGKEKPAFASSTKLGQAQEEDAEKSARSRMNLQDDGLFFRHVGALVKKRAANFRRDKKAWVCTTLIPTLFVLIGLIINNISNVETQLDTLVLTLEDFNQGLDPDAIPNPIMYNPPGQHVCQPGLCVYQQPLTEVDSTGEVYYFCGTAGVLPPGTECTVSDSTNVLEYIGTPTTATGVPFSTSVDSVSNTSQALQDSRDSFAASRFGAVVITSDSTSGIDLSTLGIDLSDLENIEGFNISELDVSYSAALQALCDSNAAAGTYLTEEECARFGGYSYNILYNFTALHSSPLYQGLADEALVKRYLGSNDFKAQVTIEPLPKTQVESGFGEASNAFAIWFLLVLSFPFIGGAYASFVVTERESKAKHLQTVAGVEPSAYWVSTFFWDVFNYQFPLWIIVILIYAFDVDILTTSNRGTAGGVIVTLLFYGPAAASFSYVLSFAFKAPGFCNLAVIVSGFLVGFGGPLTRFILLLLSSDSSGARNNLRTAANVIGWFLRFVPSFNLGSATFAVVNIEAYEFIYGRDLTVWDNEVILFEVLFLAFQSVVYLGVAIILDILSSNPSAVSVFQKLKCILTLGLSRKSGAGSLAITVALPEDDDVLAEQDRVKAGDANSDLIVVDQLTKVYDNGKVAVNNMSLGIPHGECFGLLGINGAGKTTTMGMLTAEFPPSSGDATLAGFSVTRQPEKTRRRIGYCPQFDAHFSNMTGREHVELYASVKGIPRDAVKEAAALKLKEVGLSEEDSDRLSSGYSGGMKRRLSLACATIGQPQIVFLDECSTGVDPVARREIWQLISDMVSGENIPDDQRTSVILTTHSMEECEALCPRIGIMANGRLRCLGSAQHLKSKFGQGYQVELKVKLVDKADEDYVENDEKLRTSKGGDNAGTPADEIFFNMEETLTALRGLTGDDYLVDLVTDSNPNGFQIWKNASNAILPLDELTVFATTEIRMRFLSDFVQLNYPNSVLRERQDNKVRYEVSSEGVKISNVFESVETNKQKLQLADYGVSQTSLEQVFNIHAAEAERLKEGGNDR